jgi:hypothetical protein
MYFSVHFCVISSYHVLGQLVSYDTGYSDLTFHELCGLVLI